MSRVMRSKNKEEFSVLSLLAGRAECGPDDVPTRISGRGGGALSDGSGEESEGLAGTFCPGADRR